MVTVSVEFRTQKFLSLIHILTLHGISADALAFRSDDAVAKSQGVSGDTVQRYVRLTNLIPELLNMVDEKKAVSYTHLEW